MNDQPVGRDEEFSAFVRGRMPSLLRAAYLLTGDQHLAEDLVQSALARTHVAWSRLRDTGNAEAYARKVMYHARVSVWRRKRFAESLTSDVPEPMGDGDPGAGIALRLAVRGALAKLTPKQRAILVLRFFEDRSEAETAELLNVSIGTVKSQTSYALGRMRAVAPELANLAEEVEVVDLEPAIRRTSKGIVRRRVAAVAATVVVFIASVAGAVATLTDRRDIPPSGPTPTPTARRDIPTSGPTPTPTATTAGRQLPPPSGTKPAAFGCPEVSTSTRAVRSLPGTILLLDVDGPTNCAVVSRIRGGRLGAIAAVPLGDKAGARQTVALSPDGTRIAWVTNDEGQDGDLAVANVGDSDGRLIGGHIYFAGGSGPRWEPDSRHLVLATQGGETFRVDTQTGASELVDRTGEYVTYSPNGRFRAYNDGDSIVVAGSDGAVAHSTAYHGPEFACGCNPTVQGVSDNGRYVVLGSGAQDPSRILGGSVLIDAATGRVVSLPVAPPAGGAIRQVVPVPGGGFLVVTGTAANAVDRVYLLSAARAVTAQAALPELTGVIVSYRP